MRLSADAVLLSLGGVPMVGNLATGGLIGLTPEGEVMCRELLAGEVSPDSVPQSCRELARHLEAGGYLEGPERPREHVRSAYLHVTQRCNLSCRFCYSEGDDRNRLADPTLDELRAAVGLLAALGCERLTMAAGEPLLRADLPEVALHARDAGMSDVVVLTNGLLVDEKNVRPLADTVSCVAVAFDGASADAVPHLRGSQNFSRLVRAIEEIGAAGIEARILPTLHAANLDDMARYERLAEELGATLSYSLLTADECELGGLALTAAQLRELGERAACGGLPGDEPALPGGARICARRSCGAGVSTLSVAADGTVYPCHMLHDRTLAMGNAFVDTADAVAASPVAARMRALDVEVVEGCAPCPLRHLCGGGCRARALMAGRGLLGADPYCELSRSYYEAVGDQLAQRFRTRGGG